MYAYEIPDWTNKKLRRDNFDDGEYWYLNINNDWCRSRNAIIPFTALNTLFTCNNWEEYKEPKKPKVVTLYRYTYEFERIHGERGTRKSQWTSEYWDEFKVKGSRWVLHKKESMEETLDD